ncbi:MAG: hypothetical protein M3Q07_24335 [Pseudobdellovibrionaceae bacterium]|nr:hypothetical protein [Pseudobdellovibrionaceae bacterium]
MSTIFLIYLTSLWLLTPLAPAQTRFIDNGQLTVPFAKGKRFKLEGNWEFYSEQLLTPETVNGATGRTWMHVPHAWKKYKILFGTYRLRFQAQPPLEEMALHLDIIATAHRVWINGREYPGRGQVSSDLKDHRGEIGTRLLVFSPRENNEILIQVSSNTTFGGIINTPALSSAHPIIAEQVLITLLFNDIGHSTEADAMPG